MFRLNGGGTRWFRGLVQPAMLDTSPGGYLITESEYTQIIGAALPINVTADMTKTLLKRLNSTLYLWNQGLFDSNDNNTIDYSSLVASNNTLSLGYERAKEVGRSYSPSIL